MIKKEAQGIDGVDVGEVQEVNVKYVLIEKDMTDKEWYYIPLNLVNSYDGNKVIFRLTKEEPKTT